MLHEYMNIVPSNNLSQNTNEQTLKHIILFIAENTIDKPLRIYRYIESYTQPFRLFTRYKPFKKTEQT